MPDEADVASFAHQQLQTSGKQHGYRWMHQIRRMAEIIRDREAVRPLMQPTNGDGVQLQSLNRFRRRRPNCI